MIVAAKGAKEPAQDTSTTTSSTITNPASPLYYPDWVNTCRRDGQQPEYMSTNQTTWMHSSLSSCCMKYYGYDYANCMREGSILEGNTYLGSRKWYVKYESLKCMMDCDEDEGDGSSLCGGFADSSFELYDSASQCCKDKLFWIVESTCVADSQGMTSKSSKSAKGDDIYEPDPNCNDYLNWTMPGDSMWRFSKFRGETCPELESFISSDSKSSRKTFCNVLSQQITSGPTANNACCFCGGGTINDEMASEPTCYDMKFYTVENEESDFDCSFIEDNANAEDVCNEFGNETFSSDGLTIKDACCICGGSFSITFFVRFCIC